jgi:hypothetical protein
LEVTAAVPKFKVRAGQREFERGVERHRICGLLARRQYGKTTIASRIALKKMMKIVAHTVIFGSVKLDLGREIVRKEADAIQKAFALLAQQAAEANAKLDVVDAGAQTKSEDRSVFKLGLDDWADLYEHSRLEFRLFHNRTTYSRTKVVALTPDAVGETGDLILDEVGRAKRFREVIEAMLPIIASNPLFRAIYTTTPPPDDTHPSFELLAPPLDAQLPVNPKGNWYKSELGVWVLRISAFDAYADGVPLYDDDTGKAISPDESRSRASDKDAWDRNYGTHFVLGGTAAVGLLQLDSAQRRGVGKCTCIVVENDLDMARALAFLREKLGAGAVGIGVDWATTEKESSNPTSVTVMERNGIEKIAVLTIVWKTRDPDLAIERLRAIVQTVNARPAGGRARRICQDATSEKYHCANVRKELGALVTVEDLVGSETIELPGKEPMTMKAYLGNKWVGEIDDGHATLAPERYLKEDFRLVKRDRGSFTTEISPSGQHGDTFDSHKNASHALDSTNGGEITAENFAQIKLGNAHPNTPRFKPVRLS